MVRTGKAFGTVVRWDDDEERGYIDLPELPGQCWVEASVVQHGTGAGTLRAGQVVEVEWEDAGGDGLRAVRVTPREDLQSTLGG